MRAEAVAEAASASKNELRGRNESRKSQTRLQNEVEDHGCNQYDPLHLRGPERICRKTLWRLDSAQKCRRDIRLMSPVTNAGATFTPPTHCIQTSLHRQKLAAKGLDQRPGQKQKVSERWRHTCQFSTRPPRSSAAHIFAANFGTREK